jgi:hypothetical protein
MSSRFPRSPPLLRCGLVLIDPDTAAVQRVVALQYNPDSLSRTLQVQGAGAESGAAVDALRLKGPPIETFKLEAEIDATDQLEQPVQNPQAVELGITPHLAALEVLVYPSSTQVQAQLAQVSSGVMEILPTLAPLTLFVWSKARVLPVRLTEFSITEEAFDPNLNPLRAKVSLGMRVLTISDLGFGTKAAGLFMLHHQQKEQLARQGLAGTLSALGLRGLP